MPISIKEGAGIVVREWLRVRRGERLTIVTDENRSGRKLASYLASFRDERMYIVGKLGIGLNTKAHCTGRSYIEVDETLVVQGGVLV